MNTSCIITEKDISYLEQPTPDHPYNLRLTIWDSNGDHSFEFFLNARRIFKKPKHRYFFVLFGKMYAIHTDDRNGHGAQGFVAVGYLTNAFHGDPRIAVKISYNIESLSREYRISDTVAKFDGDAKIVYFPRYFGFGHDGQHTSIMAMEYIATSILDFAFKPGIRMNEGTLCHVITMLHRAWSYSVEKGIVHNDIKAGNLLVDVSMKDEIECITKVKIIDWGLAVEGNETSTGLTILYSPPEKLYSDWYSKNYGKKISFDTRLSDLWSIGILAYRLLFNVFPFTDLELTDLRDLYNHSGQTRNGQGIVDRYLEGAFTADGIQNKSKGKCVYPSGIAKMTIDRNTQKFIKKLLSFDPKGRDYDRLLELSKLEPKHEEIEECHVWKLPIDYEEFFFTVKGVFMAAVRHPDVGNSEPRYLQRPTGQVTVRHANPPRAELMAPIQPYPGVPVTCYTAAILKTPEGVMEAVYASLAGYICSDIKRLKSYELPQDSQPEISLYYHNLNDPTEIEMPCDTDIDWNQIGHLSVTYPCEYELSLMFSLYKYPYKKPGDDEARIRPLLVCRRMHGDAALYSKIFEVLIEGLDRLLDTVIEERVYLTSNFI